MKRMLLFVLLLTLAACQPSDQETRTERVNYWTEEITYQEDETLLIGQEKVLQGAIPGSKEVVVRITTTRGEVVEEILSETILTEAKPAIIARGVKEYKRRTEMQTIEPPAEAVYQKDDQLAKGTTILIHEATPGQIRITYRETYIREVLVNTEEKERRLLQAPQAATYRLGTKEAVVVKPKPQPVEPKPQPVDPTPPPDPGVAKLPNKDLSWWYQPGPPSTIPSEVRKIVADHRVYWQLNPGRNVVYLTFDEGYENGNNTEKILDTLSEKGVKATFFVTGGYVDNNPDLVRRMIDEGHQLGNHTMKHKRAAPTIASSEEAFIQDVIALNKKVPSMTMLHRPPEGGYSQRSLQLLDEYGYRTVFWSFAYRDWLTDDQPDPVAAKEKILSNLHPGSILLLHPVSDTNTAILGEVIDGIYALGYSIERLPAK